LARPAHGKISRNFGEIPQDDNKIGIIFAKSGKIARDFLIFQSISSNFRSALLRPSTKLAAAVSGQPQSATVKRCFSDYVLQSCAARNFCESRSESSSTEHVDGCG